MSKLDTSLPIREVVDRTGISRELIHHYLRLELIPPCQSRGRYDEGQVRLLALIRRMRDEHQLPLDVIRQLFARFDRDPRAMELLLLGEPLATRISRLATRGELGAGVALSGGEVSRQAGVTSEQLESFVTQGLVLPDETGPEPTFTEHDARTVELCVRGEAMGVRLESLRTIASFVRLGFELEGDNFFSQGALLSDGADDLFLRREYLVSFVQNLIQARVQALVARLTRRAAPTVASLDEVIFRPSLAFRRRHGLDRDLEQLLDRLAGAKDDPELWRRIARLQLHAGRYREAAFFLEQARERWPDDPDLCGPHGVALCLSGDLAGARQQLEPLVEMEGVSPLCLVALALCHHLGPSSEDDHARVLPLLEGALELAEDGADDLLTRMLAGWLFTSVPGGPSKMEEGLALLEEVRGQLEDPNLDSLTTLPGLKHRLRLNAAYLYLEATTRRHGGQERPDNIPTEDELRAQVCALDPASLLAERAFLLNNDTETGS